MQFLSGWSSHGRITARSYDYIDTMPPDRENAEIGVKISFFTLKSLRFPISYIYLQIVRFLDGADGIIHSIPESIIYHKIIFILNLC